MDDLKTLILQLVEVLEEDIKRFYEIFESYLTDLILSKNIQLSFVIDPNAQKETMDIILSIITVCNSALNTIGVSKEKLTPNRELYQVVYEQKEGAFNTYQSFLQLGLKDYINKHLFIVILDYIIEKNSKVIENLDLFDLLPHDLRNNLAKFRNERDISLKIKEEKIIFAKDLLKYFDPSNFTFKSEDFGLEINQNPISEEDILKQLHEARQENIEVISKTSNQSPDVNQRKIPSFLNYFMKFPLLDPSIIDKIKINIKGLKKFVKSSPDFLDLENLFYVVSIFKMMGEDSQLELGHIKNVASEFISGNIFSTGRYHKPNPITIYHGLSVFSELGLLNSSDLIDLLDVEMFLENELNPLFPEKLILNFFTILSLRMIKKSGGIITDKKHLIEPLVNLNLFNLENFKPSTDMFFYLASLKLLDERFNFNNLQEHYLNELRRQMLPNGSVNDNTTDTSRTLLTLALLDSTGKETEIIPGLLKYLNRNIEFFSENHDFDNFNWTQNKIAFKIELRMLFWMLIALSQYF
ncbi:MAG: hypothetical protein EAX91_04190 [Candidatus Lokiarchaeota archaeon]|nr:hypothetical protein [Candidatus Lokiarchaeota archaeon]